MEGKRALVTRAGQRIGRTIGLGLARRGAAGVAIADLDLENAEVTARLVATEGHAAPDKDAATRWIAGAHLVRRPGTADEVANVAGFLASRQASFVTGAAYLVDGGAMAWRGSFE